MPRITSHRMKLIRLRMIAGTYPTTHVARSYVFGFCTWPGNNDFVADPDGFLRKPGERGILTGGLLCFIRCRCQPRISSAISSGDMNCWLSLSCATFSSLQCIMPTIIRWCLLFDLSAYCGGFASFSAVLEQAHRLRQKLLTKTVRNVHVISGKTLPLGSPDKLTSRQLLPLKLSARYLYRRRRISKLLPQARFMLRTNTESTHGFLKRHILIGWK